MNFDTTIRKISDDFSLPNLPKIWLSDNVKLPKKLVAYIRRNSGKFKDINFAKGIEEFKERTAGQVAGKVAEEIYVSLYSEDVNTVYKQVKKLDFTTLEDGAVFYSGERAKKIAWLYALKTGSKAIEQTKGGMVFETWDWFNNASHKVKSWGKPDLGNDQSIVWAALSKAYAGKAKGSATVFQEKVGEIFKKCEKPMLDKKGIEYKIYDVKEVTNIKQFIAEIIN
ncbi:MAG: hypothetical protein NkDv07_0961 [Candidatus Improbicoccus devescovinae]|nr:MAG: hypothetical protein NkDv07_0961 [Candidatus Improbicoccus devescovinae]